MPQYWGVFEKLGLDIVKLNFILAKIELIKRKIRV